MVVAGYRPQTSVQGQASGQLCLRVVGSQRDGQIIRLTDPKCTIGSAEGCTLRLRAAGVRAVHCLLLRGAHGTVARSCQAGTRLNGNPFVDAALVPGDRLQIGPITLEVVSAETIETPADRLPEAMQAHPAAANRQRTQAARRRVKQLVETIRALRGELDSARQQAAAEQAERDAQRSLQRQQLSDEHDRFTANWHAERQQWELDQQASRNELDQRNAELGAEVERLHSERQEFDQQRQQFDEDRQAWECQRADLEREQAAVAQAESQLEQHWTELRQTQEGLQQARGELERAREALDRTRGEIDGQRAELAAQEARLADQHRELETEQAALHSQRNELQSAQAEAAAGFEQLMQGHEALEAARQQMADEQQQHEALRHEGAAAHDELNRQLEDTLARVCNQQASWAIEQVAWEAVQAAAEERIALAHRELTAREVELACLAEQSHALSEQASEVRREQEALQSQRDEFARHRDEREAELIERAEALERLAAELARRDQTAAADADLPLPPNHEDILSQLATTQELLEGARAELAEHQARTDESQANSDSQAAELEHLRNQLEQQQIEFEQQRANWEQMRRAWLSGEGSSAEAAAWVEPQADGDADESLASGASQAAEFYEEDTVKMFADSYDEDGNPITPEMGASGGETSDDDKTIEQCFAELLNRYRGQGPAPIDVPASAPRGRRKPDGASQGPRQSGPSKRTAAPIDLAKTVAIDVATEPLEMLRRSSPEVPNFGAMREVALSHAKLAIDTHGRKRLTRVALITSTAALATLLATSVVVSALSDHHVALRTLANIGWVGAVFWVFVASKAWQQLAAARRADNAGLRQNIQQARRSNSK